MLLLILPTLVLMLLSLSQSPKDRYLRPGLARRIRANPRWGIIKQRSLGEEASPVWDRSLRTRAVMTGKPRLATPSVNSLTENLKAPFSPGGAFFLLEPQA